MGLDAATEYGDLVGPNHADSCSRKRTDLEATMFVVPNRVLPTEENGWRVEWVVIYAEWCTACGGAEWDLA